MGAMQPGDATAEFPKWESLEELFAALEAPLLAYALRLTGGREVAEDVVQEAFMKLHAQFESVQTPRRWLYRTVHNLALNQRRQGAKIVALHPGADNECATEDHTPDPAPLPDEQIIPPCPKFPGILPKLCKQPVWRHFLPTAPPRISVSI